MSAWETATGRLIDADIAVNTAAFTWSTDGAAGRYDLTSALAHEMGHLVGLAHSVAETGATMYPSMPMGDTTKRDLHADDIAGYQFLYGDSEALVVPQADPPTAESSPVPSGPDSPVSRPQRAPNQAAAGRAKAAEPAMGCSAAGSLPAEASPALLAVLGLTLAASRRRRATPTPA
jgi:MYXO-CTERM domain-containing protein